MIRRYAFTLVELLVAVTIIAILTGIVLGALAAARQTARAVRTKSLIARLDQVLSYRYDSFRTRRVPIHTSGLSPTAAAKLRLRAIRELMRMEMPERLSDVYYPGSVHPIDPCPCVDPTDEDDCVDIGGGCQLQRTGLARMFFREYAATPPNDKYNSSELLYMIVMTGTTEEREMFRQREIGDVDRDGRPEFLDGWGNPIAFLRWAPMFNDSDIQREIAPQDNSEEMRQAMHNASIWKHDAFDSRRVDIADDTASGFPNNPDDPPRGWHLMPLVYSAGPDGIYDINRFQGYTFAGSPYWSDLGVVANMSGQPLDSDNLSVTAPGPANGSLDHYDNIHNHRIEQR
jgi:prepilin-type N-terminal cleavage/methylation domain-containing protein